MLFRLVVALVLLATPTLAQLGVVDPSILKQAGATTGQCLIWDGTKWSPDDCAGALTNTDDLSEGATNLYFTNTRARAAISAGSNMSYDSGTGIMSLVSSVTAGAGAIPKGDASPGRLDISWLASGTPDGSKFVRDDRTLAQVAFSQLTGAAMDDQIPDTITLASIGQAGDVDMTGIADGECLVYDGVTDNRLEPGACGGGGSSINVEENNVEVVAAADLTGIDFLGADFDVTNSANEADVSIAAGITRDSEWDTLAEIETATGYDFSDAANLAGAADFTSLALNGSPINYTDIAGTVPEANDLETDGATGIASGEAFVGNGAGTGTYRVLTEADISDLVHTTDTTKTVEDEGTPLTQRATMNFTGDGVAVTDAGGKTVVTITGGGGGSGTEIMIADWSVPAGLSTNVYSKYIPADGTTAKFWCRAPTGDTFDVQIVQREIGVGTSNTFSAVQTCDDSPTLVTTFADSSLTAGHVLELNISNVTGSPADEAELFVYLEATTPGGTVADDAIDTAKLDDGSDTPSAGELVAVASGDTEFEYVAQSTIAAGTAAALAANGANCSAGQYPLGVDAAGAVEGCTAVASGADSIGTAELDDGSETPVAGLGVAVAAGGLEFEYVDFLVAGDPTIADLTSPQVLEAKTLLDASLGDDSSISRRVPNDSATGTANGDLAEIQDAGDNSEEAITAGTGDTNKHVYPVRTGGGTTGNVELAVMGEVQIDMDGACAVGDNVIKSVSDAGEGRCTSTPLAQNVHCIGVATQATGAAGLADVDLSAKCSREAEGPGSISGLTEKASPVSADLIVIEDSEASNAKKKVQIGNLPSGGSPGGSTTGAVQYRTSGGAFGGDDTFTWITNGSYLLNNSAGSSNFAVRAGSSQSGNPFEVRNSSGTAVATIDASGNFGVAGTISNGFSTATLGSVTISGNGARLEGGALNLKDTFAIAFSSTSAWNGSKDTGIDREAAGVLGVTNGSTGYGSIKLLESTPSASTDACTEGAIWVDDSYLYRCIASGNIGRVALVTGW